MIPVSHVRVIFSSSNWKGNDFRRYAMTANDDKILLIGVGSLYRGDDGVGPAIVRDVSSRGISGVRTIDQVGDGTDIILEWDGAKVVYVIDSMRSGADPGTIRQFDALEEGIEEEAYAGYSTHIFSIADTVRLARALGRLPGRLIIWGIEGKTFAAGADMTPAVQMAAQTVADMIVCNIRDRIVACRSEKYK
jgi:hydrogenase maturation protease